VGAWVVEGVAGIEDPESLLERLGSEVGQKETLTAGANLAGEIVPQAWAVRIVNRGQWGDCIPRGSW
jgi:hypothetical protein